MEAIQVGPGFAAEMRGVTLADVTNNDAVYAEVRAAFEKHSVLVFRNQKVSDDSQLAFSRRFGPPEVTKVGSLGTGTHFVILTTIDKDGNVVPPGGNGWFRRSGDVRMEPGDTVVVPLNAEHIPPLPLWQAVTQILYNVAISVLAIRNL